MINKYLLHTIQDKKSKVTLSLHSTPAFNDKHFFVGGFNDKSVRFIEFRTGETMKKCKGHKRSVSCITISQRGLYNEPPIIATACRNGNVIIWNSDTFEISYTLPVTFNEIRSLSIYYGIRALIFIGTTSPELIVWDYTSNCQFQEFPGHRGGTQCLAVASFHPETEPLTEESDLKHLCVATGGADRAVRFWSLSLPSLSEETSQMEKKKRKLKHPRSVSALGFASKGIHPLLVSSGADRLVRVWDIETGIEMMSFGAPSTSSSSNLGPVVMEGGRELAREFGVHLGTVHSLLIWEGYELLVITASSDSVIRVFDLLSGECVVSLTGHSEPTWGLSLSIVGEAYEPVLASCSGDRTIRFWDLNQIIIDYYRSEEALDEGDSGSLPGQRNGRAPYHPPFTLPIRGMMNQNIKASKNKKKNPFDMSAEIDAALAALDGDDHPDLDQEQPQGEGEGEEGEEHLEGEDEDEGGNRGQNAESQLAAQLARERFLQMQQSQLKKPAPPTQTSQQPQPDPSLSPQPSPPIPVEPIDPVDPQPYPLSSLDPLQPSHPHTSQQPHPHQEPFLIYSNQQQQHQPSLPSYPPPQLHVEQQYFDMAQHPDQYSQQQLQYDHQQQYYQQQQSQFDHQQQQNQQQYSQQQYSQQQHDDQQQTYYHHQQPAVSSSLPVSESNLVHPQPSLLPFSSDSSNQKDEELRSSSHPSLSLSSTSQPLSAPLERRRSSSLSQQLLSQLSLPSLTLPSFPSLSRVGSKNKVAPLPLPLPSNSESSQLVQDPSPSTPITPPSTASPLPTTNQPVPSSLSSPPAQKSNRLLAANALDRYSQATVLYQLESEKKKETASLKLQQRREEKRKQQLESERDRHKVREGSEEDSLKFSSQLKVKEHQIQSAQRDKVMEMNRKKASSMLQRRLEEVKEKKREQFYEQQKQRGHGVGDSSLPFPQEFRIGYEENEDGEMSDLEDLDLEIDQEDLQGEIDKVMTHQ